MMKYFVDAFEDVNERWMFTDDQVKLIYELLDKEAEFNEEDSK